MNQQAKDALEKIVQLCMRMRREVGGRWNRPVWSQAVNTFVAQVHRAVDDVKRLDAIPARANGKAEKAPAKPAKKPERKQPDPEPGPSRDVPCTGSTPWSQ